MNNLKDKLEKFIYPISILCLISDFIGLVLNCLNYISFNLYIYTTIIFVQFICITILFIMYKKMKSDMYLYETFANDRTSLFLAIKLLLNLKGNINKTRINKVSLFVKIVNIPEQIGNLLDERYDCQFVWELDGKNTTKSNLDKIFFRLAADNSVSLDSLHFTAIQCQDTSHRECMMDIEYDCISENCSKHIMRYNRNDAIQKNNFYLLPLEFREVLNQNDNFRIRAMYTWPKCYNALVDYLIIDPYNFSAEMDEFEVLMKIDNKIITETTNARVCCILRSSSSRRKVQGIETLTLYEKNGERYLKSNTLECDIKYIYFIEITR